MARQKRILVLESDRLLAASIASLLFSRAEYEVTATTARSLACFDELDPLEPEVVILDEELLAANISAVIRLVDRHPEVRLIVLRLRDNKLHVFDKRIVQVKQIGDFLDLL